MYSEKSWCRGGLVAKKEDNLINENTKVAVRPAKTMALRSGQEGAFEKAGP